MRIYGSSPLYNYVELIFRCKRMFIVSIIIGTVITTAIVASRTTNYDAAILVALSGDPNTQMALNQGRNPNDREITPAQRKAGRLDIWIQRDPKFLEQVAQDALLDKKHPGKTVQELARDIRKKIVGPTILNDLYMELRLSWENAEEAEAILNSLYSRFADQTVTAETFMITDKVRVLTDQFRKADIKANGLAKQRVAIIKDNYWKQPTMLAALMGENEQVQRQLNDTRLDLADAETRYNDVTRQLKTMQPMISEDDTLQVTTRPDMKLADELTEREKTKRQLEQTYSPLHPKVQEVDKQIAALRQQIADMQHQPQPKPQETRKSTRQVRNPEWAELHLQQQQLEQTVNASRRRLSDLESRISTTQGRLTDMPDWEVRFNKIERDWQIADTVRRNLQGQLVAAQIDEERDKSTNALALRLDVPPKAEKTETTGKKALLYVLGPLLGIFVAFCFSLFAESLDHTLRTPVEVERYLGKPVLAVIPRMATPREARKKLAGTTTESITS